MLRYVLDQQKVNDAMRTEEMERLLNLCIALTSEHDREILLSQILDTAMDLANCDAGTLYLLEEDGLSFCRMNTRSMQIRQGGHDDPILLPPVPLEDSFVCAYAANHWESIRIADVRNDSRFDFTGSLQYDEMTGYQTVSMLVVPMLNDKGDLIGVMQLINSLDPSGHVIPFSRENEFLVSAAASQAAICITNQQYSDQISDLLDSLVKSLSSAIDERSHYTANHTRNMVVVAEAFLDWMEQTNHPGQFDKEKRKAFLMSIWLHDVGKLAIPLEVMDKATRLGDALQDVEERLRIIGLLDRIAFLEGSLSEEEYSSRNHERERLLQFILRINEGGFLSDEDRTIAEDLAGKTYIDEDGTVRPWVTKEEADCLLIPKGTLTQKERDVMESHVVITNHILSQVRFPKAYSQVPLWASSHHEYINGEGYPAGVQAAKIPQEARLLTILDVFDALTAQDRPYKKPMSPEKALSILDSMVQEGKLDAEILSLFKESQAWKVIL